MNTIQISHLVHPTTSELRASPAITGGSAGLWLRQNLFSGWISSITTILTVIIGVRAIISLLEWGLVNAVWSVPSGTQGADVSACRALAGAGACWAIIPEKYRLILFGLYPYDEQWRSALTIGIFVGLFLASTNKRLWRKELAYIWAAALMAVCVLMWGGILGLPYVSHVQWGGLTLTLILSTIGVAIAFPLAVLVALGRRSNLPFVRWVCVGYVEIIRGVPLLSLLFMASFLFPLLMPEGVNVDKLLRAQVALILFFAAYLAEVVRGGLQAVPKGQYESAHALGLGYWQTQRKIALPQALRIVIPPLVNNFIGFFKDTTLVLVVGLYDLLHSAQAAFSEPVWQGFAIEAYVFAGLIYFVFCFSMSRYSQKLEIDLKKNKGR